MEYQTEGLAHDRPTYIRPRQGHKNFEMKQGFCSFAFKMAPKKMEQEQEDKLFEFQFLC